MFTKWKEDAVQNCIRVWLQEADPDYCQEDGNYMPVNENEDGVLEPDFEEQRYIRQGDPFPDDRDWIPCLIIK